MSRAPSKRQPPASAAGGAATPAAARRRLVALLAGLPWPLVLSQFLLILPRYGRLFREHHLQLPRPTEVLLAITTWVRGHVFLSFLITSILMVISVGLAAFIQERSRSRARKVFWLLLVFGLPCLIFIVSWLGVAHTHSRLIEGLQK